MATLDKRQDANAKAKERQFEIFASGFVKLDLLNLSSEKVQKKLASLTAYTCTYVRYREEIQSVTDHRFGCGGNSSFEGGDFTRQVPVSVPYDSRETEHIRLSEIPNARLFEVLINAIARQDYMDGHIKQYRKLREGFSPKNRRPYDNFVRDSGISADAWDAYKPCTRQALIKHVLKDAITKEASATTADELQFLATNKSLTPLVKPFLDRLQTSQQQQVWGEITRAVAAIDVSDLPDPKKGLPVDKEKRAMVTRFIPSDQQLAMMKSFTDAAQPLARQGAAIKVLADTQHRDAKRLAGDWSSAIDGLKGQLLYKSLAAAGFKPK